MIEKQFQSIGLIQQTEKEQSDFLLHWKAAQNQWEFIVADRLNKESFRESVTREVAWQLDLNRKTDFLVSNMAQLSMEYVDTLPDGTEQHIAVAFYNVHIYKRAILKQLTDDSSNRWVSAKEVCEGSTLNDQPIHPRVVTWINKWGVVQPWQ